MREALRATSLLLLGLAGAARALQPIILADTNRDGQIDLIGDSDTAGRETWSEERGALFLANIGDSGRRCSSLIHTNVSSDSRESKNDLDQCHDASGTEQRNPKYLAPLATLPLISVSDSASASVTVLGDAASKNVRIFQKAGCDWRFVSSNHTFSADELRSGLSLGIDARDVRRPGVWDGRAQVQFSVRDGADKAQDVVALRVAPILTHHHLQSATEIVVAAPWQPGPQQTFVKEMGDISRSSGIQKPLRIITGTDVWVQDHFEFGYMSIPGPSGPKTLRVVIRAAKPDETGAVAFSEFRSDTVGAVQFLPQEEGADVGKDATGNLEAVPPYEHQGNSYPVGRTIMGSRYGSRPLIAEFLDAQEAQPMVNVDTSWLYIGHVDEFMQFLPAPSERGWVMAVHDPVQALEILQKAQSEGHGGVKAVSRPVMPDDKLGTHGNGPLPNLTINALLDLPDFARVQQYVGRQIAKNVESVKREIGLADSEILYIPGLFYNETMEGKRTYQPIKVFPDVDKEDESLTAYETSFQVFAIYPSTVNGVLFSPTHYVAPDPWGPVIDGKDILKEATLAGYAASNLTVTFMDDWYSFHLGLGEIHCGSNAFRECTAKWW
ncbi:arginine deiminase [Cordyceps militaris]|uniref:Arginine deiminase n=1 Tax=Cordyceps militaris TaxID=73501 RepID=A0A2H4SG37_CORMI|nr:arginine deiminase [Cordyceps militaris]